VIKYQGTARIEQVGMNHTDNSRCWRFNRGPCGCGIVNAVVSNNLLEQSQYVLRLRIGLSKN
jgi:hypothetical protein